MAPDCAVSDGKGYGAGRRRSSSLETPNEQTMVKLAHVGKAARTKVKSRSKITSGCHPALVPEQREESLALTWVLHLSTPVLQQPGDNDDVLG